MAISLWVCCKHPMKCKSLEERIQGYFNYNRCVLLLLLLLPSWNVQVISGLYLPARTSFETVIAVAQCCSQEVVSQPLESDAVCFLELTWKALRHLMKWQRQQHDHLQHTAAQASTNHHIPTPITSWSHGGGGWYRR